MTRSVRSLSLNVVRQAASGSLLLALVIVVLAGGASPSRADQTERQRRLTIAHQIMESARFCALVMTDAEGVPVVRTMGPVPPDERSVVWMVTNPKSAKVDRIRHNPEVVLYYLDSAKPAYVALTGRARLIDDQAEIRRRWQSEWDQFYPDRERGALLIEVTPRRIEVVSAADDLSGDPVTWAPDSIEFPQP